jgi:hypothetical protein
MKTHTRFYPSILNGIAVYQFMTRIVYNIVNLNTDFNGEI